MNVSVMVLALLKNYWWLIPVVLGVLYFKSPTGKGVLGEFMVNTAAKFMLDKSVYHLIKNVTLPTEDGSTQLDHIIVSKFGVFVIETKNYTGWIFGDASQKMWTQKIFKKTSKFQNPLHQNYKHTKTLESALNLDPASVFSLIVFVGDSTFKTAMPENVVKSGDYIRFIKSKTKVVFVDDQVREIVNRIQSNRLTPSFKINRDHVNHVKAIVEQKSAQSLIPESKPCPRCGNTLVPRKFKKGARAGESFWGCSGYPTCRFVE